MAAGEQVVNDYELQSTVEDYATAIEALVARTERDGHPGVEHYWWYVNDDEASAGAIVVYADADAWLAHHHMAYEWPEMAALQATVSLAKFTVYGPLSPEVDDWLSGADISFVHRPRWVTGFSRERRRHLR